MSARGSGPYCPQCDNPATGNFCQHCGAKLGGRFCNQCGGKVAAGANFCNQCGTAVPGGAPAPAGARRAAAAATFGGQNMAWWIAGGAMFTVIMVLGVQAVRPAGPAPVAVPAPSGATGGAPAMGPAPDISNMTPIEQADRLFERIMRSISGGDSAQAMAFMPMALAAYDRARPLSHDALFHLSVLNRSAGNLDGALDNAEEVLEQDENHLLALAAAAEVAIDLGYDDEAEAHFRRILEIYDSELQRGLVEYEQHSAIVDRLRQDAEEYLATR